MNDEIVKILQKYTYNSYKELVRLQIYLADNNIQFSYTDTLSPAELSFLADSVSDYLKEKNNVGSL